MGNSFIFSAPKCSYTNATLEPFFHPVPVVENYYSNKPGFTTVVRRNIPTLYIKSSAKSKYLMIYFHGNAEDLGSTCPQLLQYYEHFQIDILAPEYPGYGTYKGKASADKIIRDAQHVIDYVTNVEGLHYQIENLILVGRSIGTGIVIQLASRYPLLKGIVLISAFTSMREVAKSIVGSISKLVIPDIFQSIDIVGYVKVPMLFVHGKKDDVIPFSHSVKLFERSGSSSKRLELSELMGHNRCIVENDIFKPIEKFVIGDLGVCDLVAVKQKVLDLDKILEETKEESTLSFFSTVAGSSSSLLLESIIMNRTTRSRTQGTQTKNKAKRPVLTRTNDDKPFISPLFKSLI